MRQLPLPIRWLHLDSHSSPFAGVDAEYYLSLVEWAGRTIRAGKPGSIPVDLERVLDRFGVDARHWAANVASYGSLIYREKTDFFTAYERLSSTTCS